MRTQEEGIEELKRRIQELETRNAQLLEQGNESLAARVAELAALQKVSNAANSSLDLNATLALTVETVAEVMRADVCSIYLYEGGDRLVLRATKGLNPGAVGNVSVRIGEGITGTAAKEGKPVALREAWADPRFRYVYGLNEEPYHSMLSVPIILYTPLQKLVGVLNIQTQAPKDFSREEISFVETVAGQIAIAIENARLYQQTDQKLQQKVNELTILQRLSRLMASTLDPKEVLELVVTQAVSLSPTEMAAIFLQEGDELRIIAAHGLSPEYQRNVRVKLGEGVVGKVFATGRPMALVDASSQPSPGPIARLANEEGYRSIFCSPLSSRGKTFGALVIYTRERHEFTAEEMELLNTFADETALALENARLYEEAQRNLTVKTALLTEMHHRVKNSLQTVAALLSLQVRRTHFRQAVLPLRESVARIQSIAAVHDLLSQEQIGQATVEDLAKQLIEVATAHPVRPGTQVEFRVVGGEVRLSSKEATVFALFMNELITNAIAHGFARRKQGTITISASQADGRITLRVRDDGEGLPAGFDLAQDMGLGLQIVQTLVDHDLRGEFSLSSDHGTVATITFPETKP